MPLWHPGSPSPRSRPCVRASRRTSATTPRPASTGSASGSSSWVRAPTRRRSRRWRRAVSSPQPRFRPSRPSCLAAPRRASGSGGAGRGVLPLARAARAVQALVDRLFDRHRPRPRRRQARTIAVDGLATIGREAERLGLRIGLEPYQRVGGGSSGPSSPTIPEAVELIRDAGDAPASGFSLYVAPGTCGNTLTLYDDIEREIDRFVVLSMSPTTARPTRAGPDRSALRRRRRRSPSDPRKATPRRRRTGSTDRSTPSATITSVPSTRTVWACRDGYVRTRTRGVRAVLGLQVPSSAAPRRQTVKEWR